jgi:hypothetical protein
VPYLQATSSVGRRATFLHYDVMEFRSEFWCSRNCSSTMRENLKNARPMTSPASIARRQVISRVSFIVCYVTEFWSEFGCSRNCSTIKGHARIGLEGGLNGGRIPSYNHTLLFRSLAILIQWGTNDGSSAFFLLPSSLVSPMKAQRYLQKHWPIRTSPDSPDSWNMFNQNYFQPY